MLKEFAIHSAKAVVATAVIITSAIKVGPMLPDFFVIKGYDTRPYVAGGAAVMVLTMLPKSVAPIEAAK